MIHTPSRSLLEINLVHEYYMRIQNILIYLKRIWW